MMGWTCTSYQGDLKFRQNTDVKTSSNVAIRKTEEMENNSIYKDNMKTNLMEIGQGYG
jgi:hypothetical protein